MAAAKPRRRQKPARPTPRAGASAARTLERRVARLIADRKAVQARHERQVATLRRGHDRRIAALVQELARLRHHEARAETLARLVAEREATLATQAGRLAELESLLQTRTQMG